MADNKKVTIELTEEQFECFMSCLIRSAEEEARISEELSKRVRKNLDLLMDLTLLSNPSKESKTVH